MGHILVEYPAKKGGIRSTGTKIMPPGPYVNNFVPDIAEVASALRPVIEKAVEDKGLRPLAREIGVSHTAVNNFVTGVTPQERVLGKYQRWAESAGLFPIGRGGPLALVRETPASRDDVPEEGYVFLPRFEVQAAAGTGAPVISEHVADWVSFKVDWLRRTLGIAPAQLALIEAVGDSMNPTIRDGNLLLLDRSEPTLRGDGIYVIGVDEALLVKRLSIKLGGKGLVISSDNEQYAHTRQEMTRGELNAIRVIGRVVWVGGRV